jgi:hypothetical protein
MDNAEALHFIREFFRDVFDKRNPDAVEDYFAPDYFDGDIGDPGVDHIQNSKEFLGNLFAERPSIGVEVKDAVSRDDVIAAFVEWFVVGEGGRRPIRKGIAVFVLKDGKIVKRHTYTYSSEAGGL